MVLRKKVYTVLFLNTPMSYPKTPVLDSLELALALKKKEPVIYNQSELIIIVTLTNQRRGF